MRTLPLLLLAACTGGSSTETSPQTSEATMTGDTAPADDGAEQDAQAVIEANCLACHSAASALGGLDLETDFVAATVGVEGAYSMLIVAPGDPDGSMLYLKITRAQGASGADMPPGSGGLPSEDVDPIRAWIDAL